MPTPVTNNIYQTLFQGVKWPNQNKPFNPLPANQFGPSIKTITKGSLISFNYTFFKNDPNPLIIVTDIRGPIVRGCNIHYLTFPYIKNLLQGFCDKNSFSYANIKHDLFIANSFRSYKRMGIRQVKKLDCAFLLNVLASVRSLDPNEVESIRKSVRDQISRLANPPAQSTPPTE